MLNTHYIIAADALASAPPRSEWHAHSVPGSDRLILSVKWADASLSAEFEAQPGVIMLGDPWEPLPTEAAPIFAALSGDLTTSTGAVSSLPSTDTPPAPPDSVATALKKTAWPGWRL